MYKDFPYICFLKIMKECRQQLVADIKNINADLYTALYKNPDEEIYNIQTQVYELKWLSLHWEKILAVLEQKDITKDEKKRLVYIFSEWYKDFIQKWQYSFADGMFFQEKIQMLHELSVRNSNWEENLKKVKVSFEKNKKIYNEKLESLRRNN